MTALDVQNTNIMRAPGQIPLRFLHSASVNFTLPIVKKVISTTLFPFSLKKLNVQSDRHGQDKNQRR